MYSSSIQFGCAELPLKFHTHTAVYRNNGNKKILRSTNVENENYFIRSKRNVDGNGEQHSRRSASAARLLCGGDARRPYTDTPRYQMNARLLTARTEKTTDEFSFGHSVEYSSDCQPYVVNMTRLSGMIDEIVSLGEHVTPAAAIGVLSPLSFVCVGRVPLAFADRINR